MFLFFDFLGSFIFINSLVSCWRWKEKLVRNSYLIEQEWEDDDLIKKKLREQGGAHQGFFDRLMHGIVNFNAILPYYENIFAACWKQSAVASKLLPLLLFYFLPQFLCLHWYCEDGVFSFF